MALGWITLYTPVISSFLIDIVVSRRLTVLTGAVLKFREKRE